MGFLGYGHHHKTKILFSVLGEYFGFIIWKVLGLYLTMRIVLKMKVLGLYLTMRIVLKIDGFLFWPSISIRNQALPLFCSYIDELCSVTYTGCKHPTLCCSRGRPQPRGRNALGKKSQYQPSGSGKCCI